MKSETYKEIEDYFKQMTPKEKAIELVGKFADIKLYGGLKVVAKNCALIVVDEVLNNLFQHHEIDYWKEVKKEIESL